MAANVIDMSEEEPFLRAIDAAPDDTALRLVYADWLEERGDHRANYLRLQNRLANAPVDDESTTLLRRHLHELRREMPTDWLALLWDHRTTGAEPDLRRAAVVAEALGRPVCYVDGEGYDRNIVAASRHGLSGSLAYVECRSQQRGTYLDIKYHLHVQDRTGREAAWEVETYNPYFGCRVYFLEWYGGVVVIIYEEKHNTYICRFGLDAPAYYQVIKYHWALDGRQLAYQGHQETLFRRLAIPEMTPLPPLSIEVAARLELMP